jgi:hypothetical protein
MGIVFAYVLALIWQLYHGGWLFGSDGRPACIDFSWIWVSGKFAISTSPVEVYDYPIFTAARLALVGPDTCILDHFDYPPTFMFFTFPLSSMPYLVAFSVWMATTLLVYLAAAYAIIPRLAAVIAAVTPIVVPVNIQYGHNGFLTAGLIGFSLVLLEHRPWVSGLFIGLLTYKPQFGVLIPLALIASRNWRALASATLATIVWGITAALVFGYEGWPSFLHTLLDRNSNLTPDDRLQVKFQSIFGLLRWAGAGPDISLGTHLVIAVIVALIVCVIWAKAVPYPLKAAALCIGSVTVTPYVLPWDLCILGIAVAFLVRDGLSRAFAPGDRTIMLVCFGALFITPRPIAPIICAVMLLVIARRGGFGAGEMRSQYVKPSLANYQQRPERRETAASLPS